MKFRLSFLALVFVFTAGVWLIPSEAQKSGGVPPSGGKTGGGQAPGPSAGPDVKTAERLTAISATAVSVRKSRPARDIPPSVGAPSPKTLATQQAQREANPTNTREVKKVSATAPVTRDGALQDRTPVPNVIPGPALSFDGTSGAGAGVAPPDTQGDIGPNHYVMMTNRGDGGVFQVFNSTTGASVLGPITLGSLFGAGSFPDINGSGDGIVVYDQIADRWLLSEFAFASVTGGIYHMSIAISETSDPTGAYFVYDFLLPTNNFPDYPKFGAWSDGYYMTVNQFLLGASFNGVGAYAFDRDKMLIGDPTATLLYFDLNLTAFPEGRFGMLPSDADGLVPPPAGAPNVHMYLTDTNVGDPADGMRAFNYHADFDIPANSTFTERTESTLAVPIPLAAFNATNPAGRADIPQRAPGEGLDALNSTQLMFRLQYRNFGTHESWATNFTVDVDATAAYQAGFRYVELRRSVGNANPISVNNEATFGPDTNDRWMGAASLDGTGNLAIVYNRSSASSEADIFWAGRLVGTAAGLGEGEVLVHNAPGVQTATFNRWGDYSGMNVDPDNDCTFWASAEYYQTDSSFNWRTRIANFSFASCTAPAQGTLNGTITNCQTGTPIQGAIVTVSGGPSNGYSSGTNAAGLHSRQLAPGTYTVSATALGFSTATQANVLITNGGTTTVNLCIDGAASIQTGNTSITAEGCSPGNGAIDPNETVTVSLCLVNTGAANTSNLVGTLQATGGVVAPSGPQNYGVVVAGGPEVCRSFTFTAVGTCGGTLLATLDLQDGAVNLGSISFSFQLGVPGGFSFTGPPVAIPDGVAGGVNVPLLVSGGPTTITDVNFRIDGTGAGANAGVNHTWIGDLRYTLTSPGGTTVAVIDRPGVPATTFGCAADDFIQTLMDDSAGTPVEGSCSPGLTGSFSPNNPLSAFNGEDANGTWTLNVEDFATPDTGSVRGFTLLFNNLAFDCCVGGGGGSCTLTCPNPVSVSNDPDQCGAVVNYPPPTAVGGCANVLCSPASGSFFPVGVTTVTCQADSTGGGGKEVCQNSSFTGPPVAIPDANGTGVNATLPVTHPGASITDVDFLIDGTAAGVNAGVTHTWVGDLRFVLTSPGGTSVTIIDRVQQPASTFGCSLNDFFQTLLDDDGAFPAIENACSNGMTGSFAPQNPLSAFDGEDPNGVWTLNVSDNAGGDTGTIRAFSLAICADGTANGTAPVKTGKEPIQPNGNGGIVTCSFTVTVNDTQPPSIDCPDNVTAVTVLTCPASSATIVNFPPPTASDNCPGVTVACVPPSGTSFPVGTTTVTCTATDASGNTATCSFSVAVFDVCLQDDANPSTKLLINSFTGDYRFLCLGNTIVGRGKVSGLACNKQLLHSPPGLRVRANWTSASKAGNASIQVPTGVNRCVIEDRDMTNNDCASSIVGNRPGKQ